MSRIPRKFESRGLDYAEHRLASGDMLFFARRLLLTNRDSLSGAKIGDMDILSAGQKFRTPGHQHIIYVC